MYDDDYHTHTQRSSRRTHAHTRARSAYYSTPFVTTTTTTAAAKPPLQLQPLLPYISQHRCCDDIRSPVTTISGHQPPTAAAADSQPDWTSWRRHQQEQLPARAVTCPDPWSWPWSPHWRLAQTPRRWWPKWKVRLVFSIFPFFGFCFARPTSTRASDAGTGKNWHVYRRGNRFLLSSSPRAPPVFVLRKTIIWVIPRQQRPSCIAIATSTDVLL